MWRLIEKLPWKRQEQSIDYLKEEIEMLKRALMKARVANFIMVEEYKPGMRLTYDVPPTISLEQLRKDVDTLLNIQEEGI